MTTLVELLDADLSSLEPRCLICILWSFFGLELKNLASVENAGVVGKPDDSFSVWLRLSSSQILGACRRLVHLPVDLAVWMDHVPWTLVHWGGVHSLLLRVAADSLEVQLLHLLQLHFICRTSFRVSRISTYLVKGLDVPLGVFEKLVNILSKHLLEVAILHHALPSTAFRWRLDHSATIRFTAIWFTTHTSSTSTASLRFWNLGKSIIWIEAVCNAHQALYFDCW